MDIEEKHMILISNLNTKSSGVSESKSISSNTDCLVRHVGAN